MSSSREESTLEQNVTNGSIITPSMWFAAFLVALPSFSFGFVLSCLNACLVTGNKNDGADCYHGNDSSCPPGTIYDDLNLTTSKLPPNIGYIMLWHYNFLLLSNVACNAIFCMFLYGLHI